LYACLSLAVNCSAREITKAFRKKSLVHHPDKGGDPEMFKKINRKTYDEFGIV